LEIYNALHSKEDLAFPIESIRELQEVLGQIHDLAMLELAVQQEHKQWNSLRFEVIPAALAKLLDEIGSEKRRLYSSVVPFYSLALESLRMHFRSIAGSSVLKLNSEAG
jgi:CHAD domain-containing protein